MSPKPVNVYARIKDLPLNTSPDDLQLANRAANGDATALRCLLLRHHDRLLRDIRSNFPAGLRSVADEEDVLQVSFAEIADRIADFQPHSAESVGAWFRKVAERNLTDLIRFHRAAKRGGNGQRIEHSSAFDASNDPWISFICQHSLTPSRAAAADEVVAALHVAIEQLPEEYQSVIKIRYLEERSVAETATAMRRSEDAVRGLSYRAITKLRQIMGRYSRYFSRS